MTAGRALRVAAVGVVLLLLPVRLLSASVPPIEGFDLVGSVDPPGRVEAYVASLGPLGGPFVETGDADRSGIPIGTVPRIRRALERLGYDPTIDVQRSAAGIHLHIQLRALDRVRQIFVSGNWPLRQDEIVRRISIRPGQAVPPLGAERDAAVARERDRIVDYLQGQGFLEAAVAIELHPPAGASSPLDMNVKIDLGAAFPIGTVGVAGNAVVPAADIADRVRHADWRWLWLRPVPFRRGLIRADVAQLTLRYHALGYLGVRILDPEVAVDHNAKRVNVGMMIRERKKIELGFEGNEHRSTAALTAVAPIANGGSYDDFAAASSAEAIAQHYREHGHMLAAVTWRRQRLSADVDRITFTVGEGPVLRVAAVTFSGNQAFSAERLSETVTVRSFPWLGFIGLGEGGYATPLQLELDVERVVDLYRANGYPDAKVRCEFAPRPSDWQPVGPVLPTDPRWQGARALFIRFVIDEGLPVRIRSIAFEAAGPAGPLPYDATFLRESLLSTVGGPYQPGLIRQDADRLKRLLGDAGHPHATAEPVATRAAQGMTILWQLKMGPQVRVGPVFVRGAFLTREDTLLQWVPMGSGSLLTTTAFERGQRNLALIQLFNNAGPISFPGEPSADGTVPMLIEVEERHDHWGVIRVGGGASSEQILPGGSVLRGDGVYASTGYEHRNLFGRGWRLLSKAEYGRSLTRADADLLDPRFFGTLFRLEISASYLRQATVRLGDIHSGVGSVGFSREMYPGVNAAVRYGLANRSRTEFLLRGAGPDEDLRTVRLGTVVGSLTASVDWLRLDNPLLPTRGFKLHGGIELAHPALSLHAGDDTFIKTDLRSLVVIPLARWLSLRHSVRYDQGFPLDGASVLPKVERFFAGGDTTIRGFELDRARVEIIRTDRSPGVSSVEYRPLGGSVRILHNVDLQFPIARPWYAGVFIDSGIVADSLVAFQPTQFRHGIGISPLLIRLPIGDISLSWAWPLDPQPGDSRTGRLHFNVGLMF